MKRLFFCLIVLGTLYACNRQADQKEEKNKPVESPSPTTAGLSMADSLKANGREVLSFLRTQNYTELIKYFSEDGVLFSPYGFIDTAHSKKLSADDFLAAIHKKWILTWGSYDGTGEPIKLTIPAYLKKFVYNADYIHAEAVGVDELIKQGNSINNLQSIYPNHHFIDYHFSGFDQKYKGMDWTSLRLVFKNENGQYFLVAIVHDQWTV